MMSTTTGSRIDRVRSLLQHLDVDAVLLTSLPDIRWASGFSGSNAVLVVRPAEAVFLTDGRYATQVKEEVEGARVITGGHDLFRDAAEAAALANCGRVAFQADDLTVAALESLRSQFDSVRWVPTRELLVKEIAAKSDDEVQRIEKALRITEQVFTDLLDWIRPGMSERQIAAEIVYRHLRLGAERMSFDPIVASGPMSALPHARPTNRRITHDDVVLLDFGCFVDGYASDMTRTIALGEPRDEVREVYEIVRGAQEAAIASACAEMPSPQLDAAAREVISQAGYGEYFAHSLGHGIGTQIHEWPRISHSADYELPCRCVVTIEPGIYLPGRFGIRIEDMIQLNSAGARRLTNVSTHLICL